MIEIRDKRVTVAGLGRFGGGISAARWLVDQGAQVLVTDQAKAETLENSIRQLDGLPVEFRLGEHREEDFSQADLVVASPAIAPTSKYLQAARAAGVKVTTEICLFVERCNNRIIGVTGTKGKSTTTAMLGEMLKKKYTVWVGGNIGGSLLADLPKMKPDDLVVLELSSFMLEYLREMHWSPHVALISMLAADHIEWHGSVQAYLDAKQTLLRFQSPRDIAVLNEENPQSMNLSATTRGRVILFGVRNRKRFDLLIPGEHNQLNAQGAFATAQALDVSWDEAQSALRDFKGLPHRLQLVHEEHGVKYFNDSIATIPDAAVAALDSFPTKKVIQIVGGYDKHLPLTAMCNALAEHAKAVLCIGAMGPTVAEMMSKAPVQVAASVYNCGDLATAVKVAKQIAVSGDIVLLSPGAASYDQFTNFEQRGSEFSRLVRERSAV